MSGRESESSPPLTIAPTRDCVCSGVSPPPEEARQPVADESDVIGLDVFDDRGALATQAREIALGDLRDTGVVPGPGVDHGGERVDLRPPTLVILVHIPRSDDEDVDVALRVPVATRGGSEDGRMNRLKGLSI
jgi:hypothetical protein